MATKFRLSDDFEFSAVGGLNAEQRYHRVGIWCRLAVVAVVGVAMASAWVWTPPAWLQPSVVGMLWASLFLLGVSSGSVRRGSGAFAVAAGTYVWLGQVAMQSLTSLVASECSLIAICSFGAGWLTTQLDSSSQSHQTDLVRVRPYQQWTIWDLAILTTLVAVTCYALPRLESPVALLSQVGFVLIGGSLCSWVAYRWVFDDHWSLVKVVALSLGSATCIWLIGRQTPAEFSLLHNLAWMLTGPLAVIAAQGLTSLAILSAVRLDQSLQCRNTVSDVRVENPETNGLRIFSA